MPEQKEPIVDEQKPIDQEDETLPPKEVKAKKEKNKLIDLLQENESLKSKLEEIENERIAKSGDKDLLINNLNKEVAKYKTALNNTEKKIAKKEVTQQIKNEAIKHGCVNPDKLIRLINEEDMRSLSGSIDPDYKIDAEALTQLIEKAKKEHEDIGLFSTKKVNFHNTTPKQPDTKPVLNTSSDLSSSLASILGQRYK